MEKILGLDLGTNSIGWAIRDVSAPGNQIVDKGVLTFEKGVGEGKSGEFPLVQKRTESRSKRRNYQAEKYRKWALLQTLIEHNMCPLTIEALDGWRKYKKSLGRKYPQSDTFIQWLRFDFDGDGKPDFENFGFSIHENHYLFRMLVASEEEEHKRIFQENPQILGRIFYQLVQRRGFRGRDEEESNTIIEGSAENGTKGISELQPYLQQYRTLGAALYHLQKEKKERIRKRYNLRSDYEKELQEICRIHNLSNDLYHKLHKAIIWQRPLRSQKGLVGVCTFEKNKSRCAVSHPLYEEFRTWVFINNLKIELPENLDRREFLQEKVYPLFYNASKDFKIQSIQKVVNKSGGQILSKFSQDTKVVSCTLLYQFDELLGKDWKEKYGWQEALFNQPKSCQYSIEDIWHVLFTFDSKEKLYDFGEKKLGLSTENAEKFSKIKIQQGYAALSLSAIKKILPYLRQGYLYSHAIYFANLPKVLGIKETTPELINAFDKTLSHIISAHKRDRLLNQVINSLISDQLNSEHRFGMDPEYMLDNDDHNDILLKINDIIGNRSWNSPEIWPDEERDKAYKFIADKYLAFLQEPINARKDNLFLKSERIHDIIFRHLQNTYDVPGKNKEHLWHPSEQENYLPAKNKQGIPQLGDPQPISRGFKNPMALKTLHKLKNLLNFLLLTGKIDEDTRIVVEIARELNDANRRKAIERWQRAREKENEEHKKQIEELLQQNNIDLDVDKKLLDKYRLWIEQSRSCLYTGKVINFTDIVTGNKFDLEHTIPASMSFDNELKNLTLADGIYNKQIKHKQIPTALPNYNQNVIIDGIEYTAIAPRI